MIKVTSELIHNVVDMDLYLADHKELIYKYGSNYFKVIKLTLDDLGKIDKKEKKE